MPDSFNFNKANLDQALMWIATQMRINPEARFVINIQHGATASGRGFDKYSSSKSFDPKKGFHRAETKESFSSSKKTFGSRQDDRASYVKTTSPASMYRKKT